VSITGIGSPETKNNGKKRREEERREEEEEPHRSSVQQCSAEHNSAVCVDEMDALGLNSTGNYAGSTPPSASQMPKWESKIDSRSEKFKTNYSEMTKLVDELNERLQTSLNQGSEAHIKKHLQAGHLLG